MNGTISNNSDERGLLPYPVILAATKGDPDAMKLVLQHYQSYISLGISTNLEAVTAQYVDVRLERKQSVLQTYHKALQPKTTVTGKEAGQETSKKAKKKSSEMEL